VRARRAVPLTYENVDRKDILPIGAQNGSRPKTYSTARGVLSSKSCSLLIWLRLRTRAAKEAMPAPGSIGIYPPRVQL
jgi:hypothetical protein